MAKRRYKKIEIFNALKETGGYISMAAVKLGCTRKTVSSYIKKFPDLADLLEEHMEARLDLAEVKLQEHISGGNLTALIFFLKTKGKHRGYSENEEITDETQLKDLQPSKIVVPGLASAPLRSEEEVADKYGLNPGTND